MNHGKICVSVCAATADELFRQIKLAEDLADVIEIRFDCLHEIELSRNQFEVILNQIESTKSKLPVLATYRPSEQGGKRSLTQHERGDFFRYLSLHKIADFEDVEIDMAFILQDKSASQIIHSFHDFLGVPDNLENIYENLAENSEIIKIAIQADDITDTISIWKLLERAKSENRQMIPIAMGESGKWTRILGLAHGAFMTYASLDAGQETAPGQVSASDLIEVYRARELDEKTEIYGIVAGSTSYTMSPYIHNAAFKFHGLNSVFVPLEVRDLDEFMRRMVKPATREIELNFKGFAVTNPHKRAIIKHLDGVDETAEKIGAVNTVRIEDGKLYGYNTDAQGFIEPLLNSYGDLTGARVAVVGAGGAARACLYALEQAGAQITIYARDLTKAAPLAAEFQADLKELPRTENQKPKTDFNSFDILVNTTPLGTKGETETLSVATAEQIRAVKLVYDLVYNPLQTNLLTEADRANVRKIGGLAMLIAQAAAQQKIWTGLEAPVKEMSRAALERLK